MADRDAVLHAQITLGAILVQVAHGARPVTEQLIDDNPEHAAELRKLQEALAATWTAASNVYRLAARAGAQAPTDKALGTALTTLLAPVAARTQGGER